jgi:hypothetical protein
MMFGLMKQRFSERPLIQQPARFMERTASIPVLVLLTLLSILFPAVLFPAHGIGDIKPLDLHGRRDYTRMLLTSDLAFPVVYSMALSIAIVLVLRKLLPLASVYLCLFPFTIVIADWFENLSLVMVTREFPEQADVIASYASSFTSLKWSLIVLTVFILLTSVAFWIARCIRDK